MANDASTGTTLAVEMAKRAPRCMRGVKKPRRRSKRKSKQTMENGVKKFGGLLNDVFNIDDAVKGILALAICAES